MILYHDWTLELEDGAVDLTVQYFYSASRAPARRSHSYAGDPGEAPDVSVLSVETLEGWPLCLTAREEENFCEHVIQCDAGLD